MATTKVTRATPAAAEATVTVLSLRGGVHMAKMHCEVEPGQRGPRTGSAGLEQTWVRLLGLDWASLYRSSWAGLWQMGRHKDE
jgi:hypothetical protein